MTQELLRRYLLDTSVFIQAHRAYYPFDVFPGFWDFLKLQIANGTLCSVDYVKREIQHGGDSLTDWLKREVPDTCFLNSSDEETATYAEIYGWAQTNEFKARAVTEFFKAGGADPWVCAHSIQRGYVLVSQEALLPDRRARKTIPLANVCNAFKIEHINTVALMRELKTKFALVA